VPRSRALGFLLALMIGGLPIVPPEHVHETDDHGHAGLLVHRHLSAHTGAAHNGVLDENEAPILTVDAVYTVPVVSGVIALPATRATAVIVLPVAVPISGHREQLAPLIHAPPRAPTGLRAPPRSSRL